MSRKLKTSIALPRRSLLKTAGLVTLGGLTASLGSCVRGQSVSSSSTAQNSPAPSPTEANSDVAVGTLEVVAELPIRPTAVVLNSQG